MAELTASLDAPPGGGAACRLALLGGPGSGKTTLSKYLAMWACGHLDIPSVDRSHIRLPLCIPLRSYSRDQDLIDFLVEQARSDLNVLVDRAFFEHALEHGHALVLLDGLDEVSLPEQREAVRNRVATFAQAWPRTPVLATSRIVGYDDAPLPSLRADSDGTEHPRGRSGKRDIRPDAPSCFEHLQLRPLADAAIDELVRRWYAAREPDDRRTRQDAIRDLTEALAAAPLVRELARNPLLATMICLVHGQRAQLPGERAKLYGLVIDTLLDTWDAAKQHGRGGFSEIDPGRQRRYLERLALQMQKQRQRHPDGRIG